MMRSLLRLYLALFALIPASCSAYCIPWLYDYQPSGLYIGAYGGINGGYELGCKEVKTNRGYYFGVNAGKKVIPNLRVEADFTWQGNDVHGIKQSSVSLLHSKGPINIGSAMANAIFDFNLPFPGSPSLGGGIGYAYADGNWSGVLTKTLADNVTLQKKIKGSFKKGGFAWQIIGDLNFFVMDDLKLNVEYRFFKLSGELYNFKFGLGLTKFF